jgi:PleD family two-component response regulator
VIEALKAPFGLDGNELFVTTSVGIALGTSEEDGPQKLLRDADVAMYQAKRSGKASYAVFEAGMGPESPPESVWISQTYH